MEINEAQGLLVSKREERKATEPPIQSTQPIDSIEETLKEVIDRARNKFFESEFVSRVEEEQKSRRIVGRTVLLDVFLHGGQEGRRSV